MNQSYYAGYLAGYQQGIYDALNGNITKIPSNDIAMLPIQAMGLSTRANNCLCRAGCSCVGDVTALSEQTLATMRHMGKKTAAEIAHWLDQHHIHHTPWKKYLEKST